jgi:putative endonuclease
LYSPSADKYYVGHSADPWDRLIHHNTDDKDTYTSKHRTWSIAAIFEAGPLRADALKIERFIKKQKSRALIEKLVKADTLPTGILAQLVRVPHMRD